jgi:hypothetical protein
MLFFRFAQSAVALFLLIVGFAAPVYAQQNKPITSGTFYEDRASGAISSTGLVLTFAQSPTNKFLNITDIACEIAVSSQQVLAQANFAAGTTSGAADLGRSYSIRGNAIPETTSANRYYSIVTNQIYYKMGPGRYPSISFAAFATAGTGTITADCVIVGNLTDN